jgi:4'-phosphopantetheinyl transferase
MEFAIDWATPPLELTLGENDIHLWRASLDCQEAVLRRLETVLSAEEKSRAAKFVFAVDRDHFIAARGILRELLAKYLHDSPSAVKFAYGKQGKPSLSSPDLDCSLHFNLSHSRGLAAYVFSVRREVGVDLEPIRSDFVTEDIAERFFSPAEIKELASLPHPLKAKGFFQCWTRKEGYIKARGEGLQIPLDSFSVTLTPGEPEHLQSADSARWSLRAFQPTEGYAGAVVGEGRGWDLRYWQWKP